MYNEIYHHGVKGMKWGVRRDRDGGGSSVDSLKKTKKNVDAASEIVNNAKNINNVSKKHRKQKNTIQREDLSKLSDKELKDRVNRLNMEQQYNQLMDNKAVIERGKSRVDTILETSGDVIKVTSSILSMAVAVKTLMG